MNHFQPQQYSILIEARFCPEIVERILRVVRHRGFELNTLNVFSYNDKKFYNNKRINLCLTVSSNKAIHLLYTQLNKLMDIDYIKVQ